MPKWGLTDEMRKTNPWGLKEQLLEPAKIITDPIHGDIYLNEIERQIVDSEPMQRLRRIRQLGNTHLVFPGATHNRFSHSLGAMRAAQDLLDAVVDQRYSYEPVKNDYFAELEANVTEYTKTLAEATVLARIGGLMHDLCHIPYGHSLEDELKILKPHDSNENRWTKLWNKFPPEVRDNLKDLLVPLKQIVLSKNYKDEPIKYPFVADIVGNTICADLLDYLPRDHKYTGLPVSLGLRFVTSFYVTSSRDPLYKKKMVARISKKGRERADIVSELLKYLRYRYELSERALFHHAKLAADAMIGKALEMWHDFLWIEEAVKRHKVNKKNDLDELKASLDKDDVKEINDLIDDRMEDEIILHGDDGLLEYLRDWARAEPRSADSRCDAIGKLVEGILNRQLFHMVARCSNRSQADALHKTYAQPDKRRQKEVEIADYTGIKKQWQLLLWVPNPEMKLKAADVLVNDGKSISSLMDWDQAGRKRGTEIYDSHKALWAFCLFAHKDIVCEDLMVATTKLALECGISWDEKPHPVSQNALFELAVQRVEKDLQLTPTKREALVNAPPAAYRPSYPGAKETFKTLMETIAAAADKSSLIQSEEESLSHGALPFDDKNDPT
jgi:HD superfamily phosphohydrolase